MYWEHFHPFGFLFFLLMVGLFITNIIMWRRRSSWCYRHPYDALTILENRLARGEMNTEEYTKLKETLKG